MCQKTNHEIVMTRQKELTKSSRAYHRRDLPIGLLPVNSPRSQHDEVEQITNYPFPYLWRLSKV